MRRQLAGIVGSVTQVTGPHGMTTTTATNFTSLTRNVTVGSEPNKVLIAWVFAENANIGNARPSSVTLTVGGNVQNFVRRKSTEITNATIWSIIQLWTLDNPNAGSGAVQATGYSGTVAGGGILVFYVSNAKAGGPNPVRGWAEIETATSARRTFYDNVPGGFAISGIVSPETFNMTTTSSFHIKQVQSNAGTVTGASCGYFLPPATRSHRTLGWNLGGTVARWAMIGAVFHPVGTSYFPGFASFGNLVLHCEDEFDQADANINTWLNIGVVSTTNALTASGVNRPQTGRSIFGRPALNFIASNPTLLTNGITPGSAGTVFAVVRPDLVQNNPWVMNMGGGAVGTAGVSFYITNSGHPRVSLYDGSVTVVTPISDRAIAENEIAIMYGAWDIGAPNLSLVGWHLGSQTTADVTAIATLSNPASTMRVGQVTSNVFDGSMSALIYYNTRLSDANITRIIDELKIRYTSATDVTFSGIPFNVEEPIITVDSLILGGALTCSTGNWLNSPISYAYQWIRNTTAISGAIESSYVTVPADVGANISCRVTAFNAVGSNSATSADVGPIIAPPSTDELLIGSSADALLIGDGTDILLI